MNAERTLPLAALLALGLCSTPGAKELKLEVRPVPARKRVPFAEPLPPELPVLEKIEILKLPQLPRLKLPELPVLEKIEILAPDGAPARAPLQLDLQTSRHLHPTRAIRRALPQQASANAVGPLASDRLHLLQGDQFNGRLISYMPGEGLHWQHPSVKTPMVLDAQSLARLTLKNLPLPPTAKRHTCAVYLANGDELMGDLVELRPEKEGQPAVLVLDTWYAGRLTIPFAALRSLTPGSVGSRVLYEGPDSAAGWLSGANNQIDGNGIAAGLAGGGLPGGAGIVGGMPPGDVAIQIAGKIAELPGAAQWRFANNSFQSRSSGAMIARDFDLPDKCSFEFDLAWQGYFSLSFNFYTDKFDQYSGNSYSLRFDQNNVYLYRISPTMGNVRIGANVNSGLQHPRTTGRVAIRVDKAARTIAMLVDGVMIHQWKEEAGRDFAGKGKGVLFVTRNAQPMRISALRIAEWDGRLPVAGNVVGTGKEDFVLFSNEDSVSGNVLAIKEGKMTLQTSFAALDIPLQRVGRVDFKPRTLQLPPATMRATLRDQGKFAFSLKQWQDGKVRVTSPVFGEADFSPAVFAAMEFNLDQPRKEGQDASFP